MDLKKAKLDDSAAIYNREPEKTTKQKWKEMNGKERWNFFLAYYLRPLIFILLGVLFVVYIIISVTKQKDDIVLSVAVNDLTYIDYTPMSDGYMAYKKYDPKKTTTNFNTGFLLQSDHNSMERFAVYCYAGDLDLFISGNTVFERYVKDGFLQPLDQIMDKEILAWFEARGLTYKSQIVVLDFEGNVESIGEEHIYGIYLDALSNFHEYSFEGFVPMTGVVANSKHKNDALDFIKYIFDEYYVEDYNNSY